MSGLTARSKVEVEVSSGECPEGAEAFSLAIRALTSKLMDYEMKTAGRRLEEFRLTCTDKGDMVPSYIYTLSATYQKTEVF